MPLSHIHTHIHSALTFIYRGLMASMGLAVLLYGAPPAMAQASLGTAQSFAVLGGSTVTNTGPTVITGNLGVSPGTAVTGFPPGIVTGGVIHANDAVAAQAQSDVTTAYNALAGLACNTDLTGQDLGGLTLTPGVYCFSSSAQLTGALTLNAQGNPNAVFVFQIGSTLTTASTSSVQVINGGQNCNAFWKVGSSATLGTGTSFVGNILALASITLTTGASISGRALARTGAVTMDTNVVSAPLCPFVTPAPPTVSKAFVPAIIDAAGVSTLTITLTNPNLSAATLTAPFTDNLPAGLLIAAVPNASTTCGGVLVTLASSITLNGGTIPGGAPGSCTVTVNVTAPASGNYINTVTAGALQTSNGNNAGPSSATLTVVPVPPLGLPQLSKSFSPTSITAGGVSTLTITLINPNAAPATLLVPLIDNLPAGVVVAATPSASTTCGGAVTAVAGAGSVSLNGSTIPGGAPGTCTVTVNVTAAAGGNYLNTLPPGALITSNGANASPAIATLVVVSVPLVPPTLTKAFSPVLINVVGGVSTLTITLSNPNATVATLTAALIDTLPAGVVVANVPNASTTCPGSGAVVAVGGGTTVTLPSTRSIPAGAGGLAGTCTVSVDVTGPDAGVFLNTIPANSLQTTNGSNAAAAIATLTIINTSGNPGSPIPPTSPGSDDKPGSVLVFKVYTSNPTAPGGQDTKITITNTDSRRSVSIKVFWVDGATCSVADASLCLTPNQTKSFLASDQDPGVTGYLVAIAVDSVTGCPINFNSLIGDEYVKFSSGHAANLGAEALAAIPGGLPVCDANSTTAVLNFDGVSYNAVPRVLAVDSIQSRADGNDTMLILNRFGGNLATGAATLGTIFGILYDDAEHPQSFTITGSCQIRTSLSNSFPRTSPRFEDLIPSGHTGWMKLFSQSDIGIMGAVINFNPNATTSAGAFNQGHNLHELKLTTSASLTIPIFPPSC